MAEMLFKLVGKQPVAIAPNETLKADEKTIFSLRGIANETGWSTRALTLLHEATFEPDEPTADDAILDAYEAEQAVTGWQLDSGKVILRSTEFGSLSDGDLSVFLVKCRLAGLDPWRGRAYPLWKWDHRRGMQLVLGVPIDTMRSLAMATGEYRGMDELVHHEDSQGRLVKTSLSIYRKIGNERVKFWGEIQFSDYYEPCTLWDEKPYACAWTAIEAALLRRAFPGEVGKFYDPVEFSKSRGGGGPNKTISSDEQPSPSYDDDSQVMDYAMAGD